MAFSKSVLTLFVLQLLLSAACISTADASSTHINVANVSVAAHCHENMASMDNDKHAMPACGHCDSSDMGLSAHTSLAADMMPVLLAIIVLPEMPMMSSSKVISLVEQGAPPHSFSLLYQTSQRILI